jgi:hypothetical protein
MIAYFVVVLDDAKKVTAASSQAGQDRGKASY